MPRRKMLIFSGVMKLMKPAPAVQEFARLGYQENAAFSIGILELLCVAVFLIPRTAALGAILKSNRLSR